MGKRLVAVMAVLLVALAVVGSACSPKAPQQQGVADFYAKNVVTLVVPYAPGGGTDYGARTFAAFWPDATGGAMVIKNMTAGSGMEAMNYLWKAKPDGLTLGLQVHANSIVWWFYKDPALQNEYNKFQFIGYFLHEAFVFTTAPHLKQYKSMAELQKLEGLKLAVSTPPAHMDVGGALIIELFNLKGAKLISGYKGSADIGISLGRGEVDGNVNVAATIADQIPQMANPPLAVLGNKRSLQFPDTPTVPELVKLSGEQKELFDFYAGWYGGKSVIAPPGVSADKMKFLRESFTKVLANQGYQAQAKLRWKAPDEPIQGEEFSRIVDNLWKTPPDFQAKVLRLIEKYRK